MSKYRKGRKLSEYHVKRIRETIPKDNKSPHWKGDKVGYMGLHNWIRKQLGTPDMCEHCGKTNLKSRQIHWANKSGKYLRNIEDWLRLCVSCHRKYDNLQKKLIKNV